MAPAPTRVLREVEVSLSREQRRTDAAIEAFRRDLLGRDLPGLKLAG
jgi:hypothetical protein